jgi:hypothetical protein
MLAKKARKDVIRHVGVFSRQDDIQKFKVEEKYETLNPLFLGKYVFQSFRRRRPCGSNRTIGMDTILPNNLARRRCIIIIRLGNYL